MKVNWDYSNLSASYHKRPQYVQSIIDQIIKHAQLKAMDTVCDMGSGTGYLAQLFLQRGLYVNAVEPNDHMRAIGIENTQDSKHIRWFEATAEKSNQPHHSADIVSFGSSFNVVNTSLALSEAKRVGKPRGWFLAIWNHRDLQAPLQKSIESCIKDHIPDYDYGSRRKDQTPILKRSKLFSEISFFEQQSIIEQDPEDVIEARQSHATLKRQAGYKFPTIIENINHLIRKNADGTIKTPYISRAWLAKFIN